MNSRNLVRVSVRISAACWQIFNFERSGHSRREACDIEAEACGEEQTPIRPLEGHDSTGKFNLQGENNQSSDGEMIVIKLGSMYSENPINS